MTKNKIVTCLDIQGNKHQVSTKDMFFRPSVYGVVIKEDKLLLTKGSDGYDFPGGALEIGESITDGLKREVKEETGMDVKVGKLITCQDSLFKLPAGDGFVQSILIYYTCQATGGQFSEISLDEYETKIGLEPAWINLRDIAKIKFCNSVDSLDVLQKAQEINKKH